MTISIIINSEKLYVVVTTICIWALFLGHRIVVNISYVGHACIVLGHVLLGFLDSLLICHYLSRVRLPQPKMSHYDNTSGVHHTLFFQYVSHIVSFHVCSQSNSV